MILPTESNLELSTRILYSFGNIPADLMSYWGNVLLAFHEQTLSETYVRSLEIKAAASGFSSEESAGEALALAATDDKLWTIAALHMVRNHAARSRHHLLKDQLTQFLSKQEQRLSISERETLAAEIDLLQQHYNSFTDRPQIQIQISSATIVLDYIVRAFLLILFTVLQWDRDGMMQINIMLVPILICIISYFRSKADRKAVQALLQKHGVGRTSIKYFYGAKFYTLLLIFTSTGTYISRLLSPTPSLEFSVIVFVGLCLNYFIIAWFFPVGRISEAKLLKEIEDARTVPSDELDHDENDNAIVNLESRFNSKMGRLEAFVLESALFGALSFSGFLQIMSTDMVSFEYLEKFAALVFQASQAIVNMDITAYQAAAVQLNTKGYLFCLVSVETLICSVFFLAVIAVRLRFSNVADRVSAAVNVAKVYNEKEEALIEHVADEGKVAPRKRLETLTHRVNDAIRSASQAMASFDPIVNFMQYFRNAGILTFLLILITSGMLVTSLLAWVFIALGLACVLYFNLENVSSTLKNVFFRFQVAFSRRNLHFLLIACSPVVLAFILRIVFHVRSTNWLIALGLSLFGLYLYCWLVFLPHFDRRFGEIGNPRNTGRDKWAIMKNILGALLVFCFLALASLLTTTPADSMLMLAFMALIPAVIGTAVLLTTNMWLGLALSVTTFPVIVSIIFRSLNLMGADEMVLLSTIFIVPGIIIWAIFRRYVHKIQTHIVLSFFVIAGLMAGLHGFNYFDWRLFDRIAIIYEHEWRFANRIFQLESRSRSLQVDEPEKIPALVAEIDWYISEFGSGIGFTSTHASLASDAYLNTREYIEKAKSSSNPQDFQDALLLAQQFHKIMAPFKYAPHVFDPHYDDLNSPYTQVADILVSMNDKERALQQLNEMLKTDPPAWVRDIVEVKIRQIQSL